MIFLVIGLLLFLGLHSLRIVAGDWRGQTIARIGAGPWKGIYSILSIVGFVLLVWGYSLAQPQSLLLWIPPVGLRHFASLLTLPAFVLLVAAYVPHNGIKAKVHHPMVLAVKVWALAHLLANGSVADVVLFGSFLVWAIFDFRAARLRDRDAGTTYAAGTAAATAATVVIGVATWLGFALWGHAALIGVHPFRT